MAKRDASGRFLPGTHWRPHRIFREPEYLEREYATNGRSAASIASEHGVTENAILSWLSRHGIPRRTMAQVRQARHWGVSGEANPMFGKTGHSIRDTSMDRVRTGNAHTRKRKVAPSSAACTNATVTGVGDATPRSQVRAACMRTTCGHGPATLNCDSIRTMRSRYADRATTGCIAGQTSGGNGWHDNGNNPLRRCTRDGVWWWVW